MQFREDIQGLRAIAVSSVVLFHFKPDWLPGGFVGVDIFFVISGFLMTSIILDGIKSGQFSLLSFLESRVIRIVPAMLVLCIALLIFGYFLFNIIDYARLIKHVASSISFLSNYQYWTEAGYFDGASKEKWLLHTWSLSVEWQFYFLFPIFMVVISKFFNIRTIRYLLLIATCALFSLSLFASYNSPSAAYFFLPTRAWEMLVGSLVYLFPFKQSANKQNYLCLLGLMLLACSFILVDEASRWPGYLSLMPVIGTFLILQSKSSSNVILNNSWFKNLGNWSYSIYLWHWPLVVAIFLFTLPEYAIYIGIVLSILLGYLSYTFVERKFGKKKTSGKLSVKVIYTATACIFIFLSFTILNEDARIIKNRDKAEPYLAGKMFFQDERIIDGIDKTTYFLNNASESSLDLIALGDSNVAHYLYGIAHSKKLKVALSWAGSCLTYKNYMTSPTAFYMNKNWQNYCKDNINNINKYDVPILLAHDWRPRDLVCVEEPCPFESVKENYFKIMNHQLSSLVNMVSDKKQIFIVGQIPTPIEPMYQCFRFTSSKHCKESTTQIGTIKKTINEFLLNFSTTHDNVTFINPFSFYCDSEDNCKVALDGKSLFSDAGHLSAYGSKVYWQKIESVIHPKLQ